MAWRQGKQLSAEGAGPVWREKQRQGGELRVVKIVPKVVLRVDYMRELETWMELRVFGVLHPWVHH